MSVVGQEGEYIPASVADIKGQLGSFLIVWSTLEKALDEELEELDSRSSRLLFGQKLERWESAHAAFGEGRPDHAELSTLVARRMRAVLAFRNRVVHGLEGVWANFPGCDEPAGLRTRLNDTLQFHSMEELEREIKVMASLPRALGLLRSATKETNPFQLRETYRAFRSDCLPFLSD